MLGRRLLRILDTAQIAARTVQARCLSSQPPDLRRRGASNAADSGARLQPEVYLPREKPSVDLVNSLAYLTYEQNELCQGQQAPQLPRLEHDGVPIVHHPMYSAPLLPAKHRFPMQVFQTLHDYLIDSDVISPAQVRTHANCCLRM